jgi:hypothetical protein
MDRKIEYLNTDLDLTSAADLTKLATTFEAQSVFSLHVTHSEDGLWYAIFEADDPYDECREPEKSISAMLKAIESLTSSEHATWATCTRREFNIGYDCGDEPWAFNQGLSNELLCRIAKVGASLRVTLYPDHS